MDNQSKKNIADLPANTDNEFWEHAEVSRHTPVAIPICATHHRENWYAHRGYTDNHDGTISCKFCPWGTQLPGNLRLHEGRIVDLRDLTKD